MRPSLIVIVSLLGTLYSANATQAEQRYADSQLLVGRYSAYRASPSFDQRHPLAQIVTVSFPPEQIHTVGQAIQQLLLGSGYTQIAGHDAFAAALLSKPLPDVHRQLGPMPLASALQTLIGSPYQLRVNDIRREVCIERQHAIRTEDVIRATSTACHSDHLPSKISASDIPQVVENRQVSLPRNQDWGKGHAHR